MYEVALVSCMHKWNPCSGSIKWTLERLTNNTFSLQIKVFYFSKKDLKGLLKKSKNG